MPELDNDLVHQQEQNNEYTRRLVIGNGACRDSQARRQQA